MNPWIRLSLAGACKCYTAINMICVAKGAWKFAIVTEDTELAAVVADLIWN